LAPPKHISLSRAGLLLLFMVSGFLQLKSQTVFELKKEDGLTLIGKHVSIYEDETHLLGIDDILKPSVLANFKPSAGDVPNFNITTSAVWCKIKFTTRQYADWVMESGNGSVYRVTLFTLKNGVLVNTQTSGIIEPDQKRKILGGHIIFDLPISPGDTIECFVRSEDVTPLLIELRTGESRAFFNEDHKENLLHGMYFGIMILMVLYNLFLYTTNRERVYVYYILYILFSTLFIAFFLGYVMMFPNYIKYIFAVCPVIVPAIFGLFGLLFTRKFLNTPKYSPKLDKVIKIFMLTVTIPVAVSLLGYPHASVVIIQIAGIVLAGLSLATGITVLRKGYRPAKFYVVGFGAYMVGLIILITTAALQIQFGGLQKYALEIGSAIEAIMLSFAIGDKLNVATIEKQEAQVQVLASLQENEKLIREQNTVLERKVKERTAELQEQKEVVEEKQKEILDSINYAKRIQYTLLAHNEFLNSHLPSHFVFFRPKDIVSGDFYWATKRANYFYLAICDCTGHGVPGAFMSLLNISFLNEAINEKQIESPDKVFDYVRQRLIDNVSQDGAQDGMDGILLRADLSSGQMVYAGANNNPVIIRANEIIDLPADKMPVGKGERKNGFSLYTIDSRKGDTLFLYTDGYADQFGGPKGKKFKYKQLNELLQANISKPLNEQKEILDHAFEKWKGPLEQVDDVCIIGIKL